MQCTEGPECHPRSASSGSRSRSTVVVAPGRRGGIEAAVSGPQLERPRAEAGYRLGPEREWSADTWTTIGTGALRVDACDAATARRTCRSLAAR